MSISSEIAKHGISKFTPEDLNFVTKQLSKEPQRLVLVGGQAVEVWAVLFGVPSPAGEGISLTEDADWLGGKLDAKWLCELLQHGAHIKLEYAADFDASPSSAVAYIQRGHRVLMMDFLRIIVGPTVEEIRKLAVRVQLDGYSIDVLHPLLCLHSRLANLHVLSVKRTGNGPAQARWMVDILKAYLQQMADEKRDKDSLAKTCRKIAKLSEFDPGKFCYLNFSIDAMKAIPDTALEYIGGDFLAIEWPKVTRRIAEKRARWDEQKSRSVQQVKQIGV